MSDRKRQFGGTQLCSIINLVSEIEKSTHVKLFAVHKKLENVEKRIKYSKEKTLAKYNRFRGQNKIFSDFLLISMIWPIRWRASPDLRRVLVPG